MLIALVGFIGSGKDTVGRHLVEEHGFQDMAFADALKDTCAAMFCWDREMLDGKNPQSRAWRNEVDTWWANRLGIPGFTPRWALQNIGTEVLRRHFRDDLWILNVERRIEMIRAQKPGADIVLTDGRFPNELALVQAMGGYVARVRRGPEPEWFDRARVANTLTAKGDHLAGERAALGLSGIEDSLAKSMAHLAWADMSKLGIHVSEWAWIGYPFDELIDNDNTVDSLFVKASRFISSK